MIKSFSEKQKSKVIIFNEELYFIVNTIKQETINTKGDYILLPVNEEKIYNIHSFTSTQLFHSPFNKMKKGDTFLIELGFGLKLTDESYLKIGSETKIQLINPLLTCLFVDISINYM
jgi:hypothetical protein